MKFRKMFAYAGGQMHLLPLLNKLIPTHSTYVEVFAGGATLFWNKQRSETEILNDIDSRLVNMLNMVREDHEEFSRQLSLLPNSREIYSQFKAKIVNEPDKMKRAVMYYYMLLNTWSGKSAGGTFVSKKRNTSKVDGLEWFSKRLRHVCLENIDCVKLLEKYDSPNTWYFLDPPYVEVGNVLYEHHFTQKDHVRLAKALSKIDGLFLMTYNNHPLIDLLYRKFPRFVFENAVTMSKVKTRKTQEHLIIANYDIIERDFQPFTSTYFRF
jgi:DNA adenine methylase